MIDCKNCIHSGLCMHESKAEEYIRQHKAMRDKCSLFDGEPTCTRFINNKILYENTPKDKKLVTKDDEFSIGLGTYFINGILVTKEEFEKKIKNYIEEYGFPHLVNKEIKRCFNV